MKSCYNTNFTLPKQSQRSRSVLQDRSRSLGLFGKEKKHCLITEEIRYVLAVQARYEAFFLLYLLI